MGGILDLIFGKDDKGSNSNDVQMNADNNATQLKLAEQSAETSRLQIEASEKQTKMYTQAVVDMNNGSSEYDKQAAAMYTPAPSSGTGSGAVART